MNDDRAPPCRGQLHLLRKGLLLLGPRRVVIIIIQSDLTHRQYIRTGQQIVQFGQCRRVGELSLMGVDSGRGQDAGYPRFAGVAAA